MLSVCKGMYQTHYLKEFTCCIINEITCCSLAVHWPQQTSDVSNSKFNLPHTATRFILVVKSWQCLRHNKGEVTQCLNTTLTHYLSSVRKYPVFEEKYPRFGNHLCRLLPSYLFSWHEDNLPPWTEDHCKGGKAESNSHVSKEFYTENWLSTDSWGERIIYFVRDNPSSSIW